MDIATKYPGIELKNPIIIGAGNLVTDIKMLQSLEKAGAAASRRHSHSHVPYFGQCKHKKLNGSLRDSLKSLRKSPKKNCELFIG
ncbi:MAG: hypothetical protein IEMM0006_0519 [bacterium]|nr:MAG: hypothetical protein IEMM0006_0519 [bacterium]